MIDEADTRGRIIPHLEQALVLPKTSRMAARDF